MGEALGRRGLLAGSAAALAAAACRSSPASSAGVPAFSRRMADLTHTLSPAFPFIPVQNKTFPFRLTPIATNEADGVYANRWELTEHVGTHLDAPCHFVEGALFVEGIPLEALVVPLAVATIAPRAAEDADALFELDDLRRWEAIHGPVPRGGALFLHTGWASRIAEGGRFVNMDASGVMHFPGFSAEAVAFLVEQRAVAGIGIDTLSIDPGHDVRYPVHKRLFAAGKWALECLANLETVPAQGATAVVAPVKVRGASGAPARVLAFW